jgi:signal peptidase II
MTDAEYTTTVPEALNNEAYTVPAQGLRPAVFLITALMVYIADQVTKHWMASTLVYSGSRPIIGSAFRLTLTQNRGGAWGLMPGENHVFTAFAIIAIFALVLAYHKVGRQDLQVGAAFALAMGGALGNVTDRIRLGYVVDFFDVHIIHWPIFNLADSAISISIVLLVWHFLHAKEPREDQL